MYKNILIYFIIFLFFISAFTTMTIGYDIKIVNEQTIIENNTLIRYFYPKYYYLDIENELPENIKPCISNSEEIIQTISNSEIINFEETNEPINSPMDSSWKMHGHDVRHTGLSPNSTASNPGIEKWNFICGDYIESSPVVDANGNIYFSAFDDNLYSLYPNGTLRWKCDIGQRWTQISPAIDENGIIYIGTSFSPSGGNRFFAIYPDGSKKWAITTEQIFSSPAIGDDGTIYFGAGKDINALYPNGTLKWSYRTGHLIYSSPAIDNDGIVYCGSHDTYLYALYPNNGTVKWKFKTGSWVHGSPTIGEDGTIYIGSDDKYLYALYPNNGTMKWKCSVGSMRASPAIDKDGILYFGVWENRFYAVYPNGAIKWSFDPGINSGIWGSSAALSADGTIYFGTCVDIGYTGGGDIIALTHDGSEKWRKRIADDYIMSSPCIDEDGTVYIGSASCVNGNDFGYLHAFGYPGPNPLAPTINGPASGKPGTSYTYIFTSIDPDDDHVSYYIDWNDGTITDWTGYQPSGEPYSESHTWSAKGDYTIRVKAKDTEGYESDWGTLTLSITKDKSINNLLITRLIERLPLLQKFLFF